MTAAPPASAQPAATPSAVLPTVDRRALVLLIAGQTCVGLSPILVRFSEVPATASAFWRMALALPALLIWARFATGGAHGTVRPGWRGWTLIAVAGLAFAGDLAGMHVAIALTSVANATFLTHLAPVLVVPLAWAAMGERPRAATLVGLALALVGGALLAADTGARPGASGLGDAFGLLAATFFAVYLLTVAMARRRLAAPLVTLGSATVCAVALLPGVLLAPGPVLPATATGWAALIALGTVAHAMGHGLTTTALGRLPVGAASLAVMLPPAIAAILAWPFLGEQPSLTQAAGAVCAVAAIALARRR